MARTSLSKGTIYTTDSVERGLKYHVAEGRLRSYLLREDGKFVVAGNSADAVVCTLRDAAFICYGLASASLKVGTTAGRGKEETS